MDNTTVNSPCKKMNQVFSLLMNIFNQVQIHFFFLFGTIFFLKEENREMEVLILYGFHHGSVVNILLA
jgi:hypothetical protein